MAKKKKRSSHRRRRRVSGMVGKDTVMEVVGLAVGAVAGQLITTKMGDKLDPKILAGLEAVGGILVASKGKGIIAAVGKGIAVSGVLSGAKQLNLISGIGGIGAAPLVTFDNNALGYPNMSVINGPSAGYYNNPIAGMNEMSVINGVGGPMSDYY